MPTSVKAIKYRICGLDDNDVDSSIWSLTVEWRGPGDVWAVKHLSKCYCSDGTWDIEPSPSNRDDEYKATHRFTKHEAMAIALQHYPSLIVNGMWVRDDEDGIGHLVPADGAAQSA